MKIRSQQRRVLGVTTSVTSTAKSKGLQTNTTRKLTSPTKNQRFCNWKKWPFRRWWRNVLPSWNNFVQKSLQTWLKRCIGVASAEDGCGKLTRWTAGKFINVWRVNFEGSTKMDHSITNLLLSIFGRGWCFFITTMNFKGGFRWFSRKILHCLVPGSDSWPTASAR